MWIGGRQRSMLGEWAIAAGENVERFDRRIRILDCHSGDRLQSGDTDDHKRPATPRQAIAWSDYLAALSDVESGKRRMLVQSVAEIELGLEERIAKHREQLEFERRNSCAPLGSEAQSNVSETWLLTPPDRVSLDERRPPSPVRPESSRSPKSSIGLPPATATCSAMASFGGRGLGAGAARPGEAPPMPLRPPEIPLAPAGSTHRRGTAADRTWRPQPSPAPPSTARVARPRHARSHRERPAQRPPRDGRGAVPLRDVPGHPRAARRVPDDHRPRGTDDRRSVRLLRARDAGRAGVRARARRCHPAERPLQVRRRDQPHQRLDGADPDLLRRGAGRLQLDVRPHDGRRRSGAGKHADRGDLDLRRRHPRPADQDPLARRNRTGRRSPS